MLTVLAALFSVAAASDVGATFGDGAISQLLRHAAAKALEEPRVFKVLVESRENASWPPLASLDVLQAVDYRNLSVHFHRDAIHLIIDRLSLASQTHVSDIFWPMGLGDKVVNVSLEVPRSEVRVDIDEDSLSLTGCQLTAPSLNAGVDDHWFANRGISMMAYLLEPALEAGICSFLRKYLNSVQHSQIAQLPIHDLIPEKARQYLAAQNATAFYKLKSIRVEEEQLTARAQLEWQQISESDVSSMLSNTSVVDVELRSRDMVTFWVEDTLLNNLLAQVDWQFEWMNEQIPVTSAVIPPDSREFLSTLCTQCYFQVNVAARGQPTVTATNDSLVLEKRDRVHLEVVNPDRNVTSVFVSFLLTIQAEVRPIFDDGTLRTQVQLLDTNIEMENGAFPKNWGLFMQDLMRGMIMDMLWPEIKNAIEELSYGKGLRISRACGVDPTQLSLDIGEGTIALSSRLLLTSLDPEACIKDLRSSLPNTSKIFGQHKK